MRIPSAVKFISACCVSICHVAANSFSLRCDDRGTRGERNMPSNSFRLELKLSIPAEPRDPEKISMNDFVGKLVKRFEARTL